MWVVSPPPGRGESVAGSWAPSPSRSCCTESAERTWRAERKEPWQRKRFAVPQGLTGWWQINGRSDKPMHLNTEDDLYYVYNYSLWLDLRILLMTPFAALRGRGAF